MQKVKGKPKLPGMPSERQRNLKCQELLKLGKPQGFNKTDTERAPTEQRREPVEERWSCRPNPHHDRGTRKYKVPRVLLAPRNICLQTKLKVYQMP